MAIVHPLKTKVPTASSKIRSASFFRWSWERRQSTLVMLTWLHLEMEADLAPEALWVFVSLEDG
jgi:hypothetical protein